MKRPTVEQQKAIVAQWKHAGPKLAKFRREELRRWVYDTVIVDALLDIGARFGRSRHPSGMVEMQRLFKKMPGQRHHLQTSSARRRHRIALSQSAG